MPLSPSDTVFPSPVPPSSASVEKFLAFNDYKILPNKGHISAADAKTKAESEYDIFNKTQRIDSDFDKQIRGMMEKKEG